MNLLYGNVVEVFRGPDSCSGKIRVDGAFQVISLDLLTDPAPGDKVLVCDGVAIGRVERPTPTEAPHVSGHTR
jgi:hydrogenase maturation factor